MADLLGQGAVARSGTPAYPIELLNSGGHAVAKGQINRGKILEFFEHNRGKYSATEIARLNGMSYQSATVHLQHLVSLGILIESKEFSLRRPKKGILVFSANRKFCPCTKKI